MATNQGPCGPRKYAAKIDTRTVTYQIATTDTITIPANNDRLSINFRNNNGGDLILSPELTQGLVADFDRLKPGEKQLYVFDEWGPIVTRKWALNASGSALVAVVTEIFFVQ